MGYCSRNAVPLREQLFTLLRSKDKTKTSHGLGICQNTTGKLVNGHWRNLTEIYKSYRFVIACENKSEPGYLTEKLINAFIGGAIPIYWGDNEFAIKFFNPKSFINLNDWTSLEEATDYIIALDNDDARRDEMATANIWKDSVIPDLFRIAEDDYFPEQIREIATKIKPALDEYYKCII